MDNKLVNRNKNNKIENEIENEKTLILKILKILINII